MPPSPSPQGSTGSAADAAATRPHRLALLARRGLPFVAPVVLLLALLVLRREFERFHLRDLLIEVRSLPAWRLGAALGLTSLSYLALGLCETLAVHYAGAVLRYRKIAAISFVGSAIGNNLGNALLAGGSVRARLYSQAGVSAPRIARIVVVFSVSFWLGLAALGGCVFLAAPPPAAARLDVGLATVRLVGGLCMGVVAAYAASAALGGRHLMIRGIDFSPPPLGTALTQLGLAAADLTCAAAALYLLLSPGIGISFPAFLGIFLFAQIGGVLSQVPGGVGVFESAVLLMLEPHAGSSHVLGALLVFRIVYYLLPLALASALLTALEGRHRLRKRA